MQSTLSVARMLTGGWILAVATTMAWSDQGDYAMEQRQEYPVHTGLLRSGIRRAEKSDEMGSDIVHKYVHMRPAKNAANDNLLITAPLPGMIKAINVKVGDQVFLGQQVCVTETMKMEFTLRARSAGTVKKINFNVGDIVAAHDVIVELQ